MNKLVNRIVDRIIEIAFRDIARKINGRLDAELDNLNSITRRAESRINQELNGFAAIVDGFIGVIEHSNFKIEELIDLKVSNLEKKSKED